MPRDWKFAIIGQTLGRRFLLEKRLKAKRVISKLTSVVEAVKESRDVSVLIQAIQVRAAAAYSVHAWVVAPVRGCVSCIHPSSICGMR